MWEKRRKVTVSGLGLSKLSRAAPTAFAKHCQPAPLLPRVFSNIMRL
jgi:hypothetical protein